MADLAFGCGVIAWGLTVCAMALGQRGSGARAWWRA
jgi:hypothetical protein